jgi:hypothetical protein
MAISFNHSAGLMENAIYELKNKRERFIVFKFLQLIALYLLSWLGLWGMFLFSFRRTRPEFSEDTIALTSDVIIYLSLAIVVYYVFSKVKNRQVEKAIFDYSNSQLTVVYKSYFLHIPGKGIYPFLNLSSTLTPKSNLFYGEHFILRVYHKNKRVVYIGGSADDWQRLPNFLKRIHERISEIKPM